MQAVMSCKSAVAFLECGVSTPLCHILLPVGALRSAPIERSTAVVLLSSQVPWVNLTNATIDVFRKRQLTDKRLL